MRDNNDFPEAAERIWAILGGIGASLGLAMILYVVLGKGPLAVGLAVLVAVGGGLGVAMLVNRNHRSR